MEFSANSDTKQQKNTAKIKAASTIKHVNKPHRTVTPGGHSSSHNAHQKDALAIHSSPMQLATRSLSARSLASSQSADSAQSAHRPTSSVSSSRRKSKPPSATKSRRRIEPSKEMENLTPTPVNKGFNIADHLQRSVDNGLLRGSADSDVQKMLQDISSAMCAVSPTLDLDHSQGRSGGGVGVTSARSHGNSGEGGDMAEVTARSHGSSGEGNKRAKKAHLRSKVAANFNLPVDQQIQPTLTTPHSKEENSPQEGEGPTPLGKQKGEGPIPLGKQEEVGRRRVQMSTGGGHHNNTRPQIPQLKFGTAIPHQAGPSVGGRGVATQLATTTGNDGGIDIKPAAQKLGRLDTKPAAQKLGGHRISEDDHQPLQEDMDLGTVQCMDSKVRDLLEERRAVLSRSRLEELERAQQEVEVRERKQQEKEQRRAAKMKLDRMAAIAELKKKREEKRTLQESLVQEEMSILEASGKVRKPRTKSGKESTAKNAQESPKIESKSADHKPANHKSADYKPVNHKSTDHKSTNHKSTDHKFADLGPPAEVDEAVEEFFGAGNLKPPVSLSPPINHGTITTTSSTYDEIMDTLRLLEEVPSDLGPPVAMDTTKGHGSGGLSEGKLQSILSYLDQVEQVEVDRSNSLAKSLTRSKAPPTFSSVLQPPPPTQPGTDLRQKKSDESELEAASAVASDVTATILAQRMELDSKTKTVEMLQKALNQQRELTVYHAKEMEKEGQRRMDLQRVESETTIQRHQCFIDQLIDDKKVLSERCEKLVKELRELDKKYKSRLATLEDSHSAELSKLKQVSAAADKMRRERWRAEETQRIKEATVKGLEPEIQRIIARGKGEVQRQKALHEAELMQADERASRKFVAQMEEVREQCALEKEQACAHERELARQRYEKMAEQEELNYQQQRRRLFGEVAQEKDKLADQFQKQKAAFDLKLKENTELHDRRVEELKIAHQQEQEEVRSRHRSELRNKEERLGAERQAWEENLLKSQSADMMTREREMKTKLREERDKEIEMVITRLEEETASAKEETERASENRVRRIREKYEAELKEVERSERSTLEKFNTMKGRVADMEGEVSSLRSQLRHRDQEVQRVGEVAAKLTQERDTVSDVVRQEFADRLVSTEEENKQLKIEMSELRARHKVELERVQKTKAKELEEVHGRVRQALEKKEGNLSVLKEQYEGAVKRADHLQMLLQRQRTELLKK